MTQLEDDLQIASTFGGSGTGVTRLAWSDPLIAVSRWLAGVGQELGFDAGLDAAGNCIVKWSEGTGKALVVGSHLDTVPCGGRFDGALGVLSGLTALRTLRSAGFRPRRPIWLVAFMDEEGTRFGATMFGSRAFVGEDLDGFAALRDRDGISLAQAMTAAGFELDRACDANAVDDVGLYLELHIEQGRVLESAGAQIGIVTGICGLIELRVRLDGQADHAGTTPMELRRDALVGASLAIAAIRDLARADESVRATVGKIAATPGGANVVPGSCEFSVDIRATASPTLERAESAVREIIGSIARDERLTATIDVVHRLAPLELARDLQHALEQAARSEGVRSMKLASGAGHDAMVVGRHVPTGMLFVPSRDGISHNPLEYTEPADCERGARVLARAIADLAGMDP